MDITEKERFYKNLRVSSKKRRAVSELMGTLIMVTITLVAGAAVFGWINGQAGSSESAYGASVANNIDFLREHFVVVTQSFAASPPSTSLACSTVGGSNPNYECTLLTFWPYNSGQVGFTLYSVRIQNVTDMPASAANKNPLNAVFYPGASSACSGASQTCGFAEYNKAGTTQICAQTIAWTLATLQPGFYQFQSPLTYNLPSTLAQGQLASNPYEITMPTGATCSGAGAQYYLYDGIAYTLTFTGLYGNTISTTITVNG
jgi:flagellin-like protein